MLTDSRILRLCVGVWRRDPSAKSWAHYQPTTVVLAFFTHVIAQFDAVATFPNPNKVIRLIYTLFDELFARSVEQEEEIIFVVRSVTIQLQNHIRAVRTPPSPSYTPLPLPSDLAFPPPNAQDTVFLVVPLLRHLVRFSSIPKLRALYNHMYDIRDFYCTEFLGRGQFAEVIKGAFCFRSLASLLLAFLQYHDPPELWMDCCSNLLFYVIFCLLFPFGAVLFLNGD